MRCEYGVVHVLVNPEKFVYFLVCGDSAMIQRRRIFQRRDSVTV